MSKLSTTWSYTLTLEDWIRSFLDNHPEWVNRLVCVDSVEATNLIIDLMIDLDFVEKRADDDQLSLF